MCIRCVCFILYGFLVSISHSSFLFRVISGVVSVMTMMMIRKTTPKAEVKTMAGPSSLPRSSLMNWQMLAAGV